MKGMTKLRRNILQSAVLAALAGVVWTLVPSASGQTAAPEALPAHESASVGQFGWQRTVETTQPEPIAQNVQPESTPWGTPVLVSPANGAALFHYPRTTTLIWNPVIGAVSYLVESAFLSGSTWVAYPEVTVTGNSNSFYTFAFVGDQKGRWRVTAFDGTNYSAASAWWTFSFNTTPQMETPILTTPAANVVFDQYPRTLTLSWKMVPAATGYYLETAYCQAGEIDCVSYPAVTITDPLQSDYTFSFIGAQPGKWRVTTLSSSPYRNSAPSAWRWFTFLQ
jgi:hypothetical protein